MEGRSLLLPSTTGLRTSHNSPEILEDEMRKLHAVTMVFILCAVTSLPLVVQGQSEVAERRRAEVSLPLHFDRTTKPLREMFETGERPEPARGGRDFEPGRPQPVGHVNRPVIDPLADKSVGSPSALAEPKASTI